MTTALEEGEWLASRPGCTLPPVKTRYSRLGGLQGRCGRVENLAPPGFDPRTVQPIVSHYTDWATRPTDIKIYRLPKTFINNGMHVISGVLIIPAFRKHHHKDYSHQAVQTVHTATKLTTSTYCNYDSWHSSQCCIGCILPSTITITYVKILIYWFYWFRNLNDFLQL